MTKYRIVPYIPSGYPKDRWWKVESKKFGLFWFSNYDVFSNEKLAEEYIDAMIEGKDSRKKFLSTPPREYP